MEQQIHSVLGLGFGPANLSLAAALEEFGYGGSICFLEQAARFQWQREQLLPGTDIQNNPFRDLIMATNPNSRHTFVNYLASRGVLTNYLHLNVKFPLRREYGDYMAWVAASFRDVVDYGQSATHVSAADAGGRDVFQAETADGRRYLGESLILGVGRSPRIPAAFSGHEGPFVFHSSAYVSSMQRLGDRKGLRVTVVGSSQSAIEIVLDLLARPDVAQVVSLHRGIGFRLKDTSPYSRQAFLPEFVDYFYPLPKDVKRRLREQLKSVNYAACDQDVIDQLAVRQHEYELTGSDRLRIIPFSEVSEVQDVGPRANRGGYRMTMRDVNNKALTIVETDSVVLATGFRDFGTGEGDQPYHPMLEGIADRLDLDDDGLPVVARDYSVRVRGKHGALRLYLNGLCEPSHGLGDAGALAVLPARAADIAQSIMVATGGAESTWPEQPTASVII
jgi:L-ornithine N5-monooxygenase